MIEKARIAIWTFAALNLAVGTFGVVFDVLGWWAAVVSVVVTELTLFYCAMRQAKTPRPLYVNTIVFVLAMSAYTQIVKIAQTKKDDSFSTTTGVAFFILEILLSAASLISLGVLIYEDATKPKIVEEETKTMIAVYQSADMPPMPPATPINKPPKPKPIPQPKPKPDGITSCYADGDYTLETIKNQLASGMTRGEIARYHAEKNGVLYATVYSRASTAHAALVKEGALQ